MSEEALLTSLSSDEEYQEILSGRPQTRGMRSGKVFLKQGQSCGRHSTEAHEEMLVFLAGKGIASVFKKEKSQYEVGNGKVFYIPPYTEHNIENPHPEPLVYIYCVAPVGNISE